MNIAAIYDTGTAGQEFIDSLKENQDQNNIDEGFVIWHFDADSDKSDKLISKMLKRMDIIFTIIIANDDEDISQYLPL